MTHFKSGAMKVQNETGIFQANKIKKSPKNEEYMSRDKEVNLKRSSL